jgi:hypothetical protein
MKKYVLAAALVFASASAMADREITTDSTDRNIPLTKSEACSWAKHNAESKAQNNAEEVKYFKECVCDPVDSHGHTQCTVVAGVGKKSK